MPKIAQTNIEISLEKFLNDCNQDELYELELLLNKKLNLLEKTLGITPMDRASRKHKIAISNNK